MRPNVSWQDPEEFGVETVVNWRYGTALALFAIHAACGDAALEPTRDASPLQTDQLVYVMETSEGAYAATVVVRYSNGRARPLYIQNCTQSSGRLEEPSWEAVRQPGDTTRFQIADPTFCFNDAPPFIRVDAQESRLDTFLLRSLRPPVRTPSERATLRDGLFRIEYQIFESEFQDSGPIPVAERQSNSFLLRHR